MMKMELTKAVKVITYFSLLIVIIIGTAVYLQDQTEIFTLIIPVYAFGMLIWSYYSFKDLDERPHSSPNLKVVVSSEVA
jgi:hypothetical protein